MTRDETPLPPAAGFVIYPGTYLSDARLTSLSNEHLGVFFRLLLHEWKQIGLSSDHHTLAKWAGLRPQKFARAWPALASLFVLRDGRYFYPPNDLERARIAEKSQQASGAAAARWGRGGMRTHSGRIADAMPSNSRSNQEIKAPPPAAGLEQLTPEALSVVDDFLAEIEHARRSTTRWTMEICGWLEGLNLQHAASADDIRLGLSDYLLHGQDFSPAHVRSFVERATRKRLMPEVASTSGPIPSQKTTDAAHLVTAILGLQEHNGRSSFIPRDRVQALGDDVLRAYIDVGGADRFLDGKPEDRGYLIRDFERALLHVRTSPGSSPAALNPPTARIVS